MENKTGKYFKYAIGEIVLVVIGILIALSINNWNESRKERVIENKILNEIYANMKLDVSNLKFKINETNNFKIANIKVLEHLEKKTPLTDSLKFYYARLNGFGNFRPITVGYENLKSKGVDIIQNDSLRASISELYDFKYFFIVEDVVYAIQNFSKEKSENYYDNVMLTEGIFQSAEPYDLEKTQNDKKFKGLLKSTIVALNYMNSRRTTGIEQIEEVMGLINEELKKNESTVE
jgi:hypothetical protein